MSRRGKYRNPAPPSPSTGVPSPAEIIVLYPNSGWEPGMPVPSPEFVEEVTRRKRLQFIAGDLIGRLGDEKPRRVQAARKALKELSGVDHGPEPDAALAERERAQAAWRTWLEGQK